MIAIFEIEISSHTTESSAIVHDITYALISLTFVDLLGHKGAGFIAPA